MTGLPDLSNLRPGASNAWDYPDHPGYTGDLPHSFVRKLADRVMADTGLESYPEPCGPEGVDPTAGKSFPGAGSPFVGGMGR